MNERIKQIVESAINEDVTKFMTDVKAEVYERLNVLKESLNNEAVERLGQKVAITESKKSCKCEEDEDPKKDGKLVEPEKGDEDAESSDAGEKKEKESDDDDDDDDDDEKSSDDEAGKDEKELKEHYTPSGYKNPIAKRTMKIKEWYSKNFADDDLKNDINPSLTFEKCYSEMVLGKNFYTLIKVSDSLLRERVFGGISDAFGIEYDSVYEIWLLSAK